MLSCGAVTCSLVCVLAALCAVAQAQEGAQFREVDISGQGRVRGFRAPGTDVFAFFNVPYATAPTGQDKFKAPLPPPTWSGTFEAAGRTIICPQNMIIYENANVTMQEDCLIANILQPDTVETNLPVLVHVHGGAFQIGSGSDTFFSLLKSKKIVVVNFNYRLGIHGFLCLGNKDAPGNAGMKDQVALLRWVRDNIASFGGNPNDVTVRGCSAGGASVDLLILSYVTDGLMHKAMPESGSNAGAFAVQFDPLQNAKEHALRLNFNNVDDIDALTEFYKSLSYDILTQDAFMDRKDSSVVFAPCVEKDIGQEIFLEEAPIKILQNSNFKMLPMYYGFTNLEGAWRYDLFYEWQDLMNERFSDFLPADLEFENEEQREEVAALVKHFYFGSEGVTNDTLLSYMNYNTDVLFVQGMLRSARLQVQAGNKEVYLYEYSFSRSDIPPVPGREYQGASHCFQEMAVVDEDEEGLPQDYLEMKEILRELWLGFIVHGNPTPPGRNNSLPTWPPTGVDRRPHYALGEIIHVGGTPVENRTLFWDQLFQIYHRTPVAPGAGHMSTILSKTLVIMCAMLSMFSN